MRQSFTVGLVLFVATACGGESSIGKGLGPAQDSSGGKSGTIDTGSGGASDPGGGKGGRSEASSGGASDPGGGKGGDPVTSSGGSTGGTGDGLKCETYTDCLTPGTCRGCPDGSQICSKVECTNHQCVTLDVAATCAPACDPALCPAVDGAAGCCLGEYQGCGYRTASGCRAPGAECTVDADCPIPPVACMPCPGDTCANAWTQCQSGKCVTGIDECAGALHWERDCAQAKCDPAKPPARPCEPAKSEKETGHCEVAGEACVTEDGCTVLRCADAPPQCP